MSTENPGDFEQLLLACAELSEQYPHGVVYIGGIAVYLHAINSEKAKAYAEFTHDADFYISMADMADLRDAEELTPNRRLSKHQLRKRGFEFDIYTERHSALIVPYDQVFAHSVDYGGLRVAGLEHLLALKLEAFADRQASSKGDKDAKDIIRIALISEAMARFDTRLATPYLSDKHTELLGKILKGAYFQSLARGNSKIAKNLRKTYEKFLESLKV